ncbi:unnamed protein product [Ixodes hexagonus]
MLRRHGVNSLEIIARTNFRSWCTDSEMRRCASFLSRPRTRSCAARYWRRVLCTSSGEENDQVAQKKPAVSYMGLGFGRVRYTRRQLLREATEPKTEDGTILPVYFSQLREANRQQFRELYPELADALDKEDESDVAPTAPTQEVYQYPFDRSAVSPERKPESDRDESAYNVLQQRDSAISGFIRTLEESPTRADISEDIEQLRTELWRSNYGSANPSVPPSKVPCGGCGAFLHCTDVSIPGFMPSEVFVSLTEDGLRSQLCQRCLYLQHFNTALNVKVDRDAYLPMLAQVRGKKALALLMVDLTDMPCSLWHDVTQLLGPGQPVLVVANKVDLLPCDSPGYLARVKACVEQNLKDAGLVQGVKGVCLVSAKTGYGVEDLISQLHNVWRMKGDVYLIGCTNVGKSTLFNALLQSDLCQENATDLIQRATTSVWPGTTLSLLKFPMMVPSGWRLHLRLRRLARDGALLQQELAHRRQMYQTTRKPQYATLIGKGRIGMTFKDKNPVPETGTLLRTYNPESPVFKRSHFCYDTPGAVYRDQILDILTLEELLKVLPKEIITPRTVLLRLNQTLFLSGLARVDLLQVPRSRHIYATVFASHQLPIHIVDTPDADEFYSTHLGTEMLGVPLGSAKRLADFPPLEGRELSFLGQGWKSSCGDVVLSSTGWISFTFNNGEEALVRAWTPEGRGIHRRVPAMLPGAVQLKGSRIRGTPTYANRRCTALW